MSDNSVFSNEDMEFDTDLNTEEVELISNTSIINHDEVQEEKVNLIPALNQMESMFCLKLISKHMLPVNVQNEILEYSEDVHAAKLEIIISELKKDFSGCSEINIEKVIDDIILMDNVIGLKDEVSTQFKREKYLKRKFDFIVVGHYLGVEI